MRFRIMPRAMLRFGERGGEIGKGAALRRMGCRVGRAKLEIIERHAM
ncbi:hypothetical protein [Sphingomonas sp.]|nr:hypothetical protein [Sphingomonas sp.]